MAIDWREFLWGAIAGAFGEGMMHPIDTIKTRMQSQAIFSGGKSSGVQLVRAVWASDGLAGFYRGIAPGVLGSLATGATYFGVIESTKKWIEETHPRFDDHWAHFISGAVGDTLGSFVYVPCEVMKQRMQVQGSKKYWTGAFTKECSRGKLNRPVYGYYSGMFDAGFSIWKEQGLKGLYAGYWSTLARDVPFAGMMVMFYEAFKNVTHFGKQSLLTYPDNQFSNSFEGLLLGGLAGGVSAYLTTPLDVIKTRLQIQGAASRYNGWFDALNKIWKNEGVRGMFRGGVPRIMWYIPASGLTFMAVEFLREHYTSTSVSVENQSRSSLQEEVS